MRTSGTTAMHSSRVLSYDLGLLFPVLFLVGIGIVMIYSASSALAMKKFGSDYYFLKKQLVFICLGIGALIAGRHIPYTFYRPLAYPLLAAGIIGLVLLLWSPLGLTAGGATRWLHFGGLNVQPSEFVRFAMVVYLADSLSRKQDQIRIFSIGFLPHVVVLGVFSVLLLMEPDFGSVAILAAVTLVMLFVGGVRLVHLSASMLVLLPAAYFMMIHAAYRLKRLMSFLNPWDYAADQGYQIVHSLMAFGTGGIWGTGIGKGYQKLFYLPEPHTDFIFSVIGEELGLAGVLVIIGLYATVLWRGIQVARRAPDVFGALMALGLTTAIGLQVCVNMGVALGLLPTKGLPLPFLSYGGTSLLLSMASVGILMNIGARSGM